MVKIRRILGYIIVAAITFLALAPVAATPLSGSQSVTVYADSRNDIRFQKELEKNTEQLSLFTWDDSRKMLESFVCSDNDKTEMENGNYVTLKATVSIADYSAVVEAHEELMELTKDYNNVYPLDIVLNKITSADTEHLDVIKTETVTETSRELNFTFNAPDYDMDKQYIAFGKAFEERFLRQSKEENRTIEETLDLGWELLAMLPKSELDRVDVKILEKYYKEEW